jgi:hypothetical protein
MDLYEINNTNTVNMHDDLARRVIHTVTMAMGPMLRDGDFCDSEDIYFHIWVNGISVEIFGGPYTFEQRRALGRALIAEIEDDIPDISRVGVGEHELSWDLGVTDFTSETDEKEPDHYSVRVYVNDDGDANFTDKLRAVAGLIPSEQYLKKAVAVNSEPALQAPARPDRRDREAASTEET